MQNIGEIMKRKFFAAIFALTMTGALFAAGFPSYLKMEGTKIVGCNGESLPANLVIPEGVTVIGEKAFKEHMELKTVSLPKSLKKIEESAFSGDWPHGIHKSLKIEKVQYSGTLVDWCKLENDESLLQSASAVSLADVPDLKTLQTLTIPDGIERVGSFAFSHCAITTLIVPNSVKSVGNGAFKENPIKRARYKGTLAEYCQIDSTHLPISIKLEDVPLVDALQTLVIPAGVKKIGNGAFQECAITNLTIPEGVTEIGDDAFFYCTFLRNPTFPKSLKSIGERAFARCYNISKFVIPGNVKKIGKEAFGGNRDRLSTVIIEEGVEEIGVGAFAGCAQLSTVTIPSTITKIADETFMLCDSLRNFKIPQTVTSIGYKAFSNCYAITTIEIPPSVKEIGESAFGECNGLTGITIPDGVTKIEKETFYGCSALTTVTIPASVKSIEERAFQYCRSLTTIMFKGTKAQWDAIKKDRAGFENGVIVRLTDGTTRIANTTQD